MLMIIGSMLLCVRITNVIILDVVSRILSLRWKDLMLYWMDNSE